MHSGCNYPLLVFRSVHAVFVDQCCHGNTAIYIFSVLFFQKGVQIMGKISVLILGFVKKNHFIIRMLLCL